jgi:hypothetical protein
MARLGSCLGECQASRVERTDQTRTLRWVVSEPTPTEDAIITHRRAAPGDVSHYMVCVNSTGPSAIAGRLQNNGLITSCRYTARLVFPNPPARDAGGINPSVARW